MANAAEHISASELRYYEREYDREVAVVAEIENLYARILSAVERAQKLRADAKRDAELSAIELAARRSAVRDA